jgi:signal peptide peptidase SppA
LLSTLSVDRFLSDKPLAITPAGLEELRAHIEGRLALFGAKGNDALAEMAAAAAADRTARSRPRGGAVGVIPIRGTLSQHASDDISAMLFGGSSTEGIAAQLHEFLADESVGSILLDIDSPGGSVNGITELAAEIYKAGAQKPLFAVANAMSASASYWLGSQARGGFFITPSGLVGSIGVIAIHQDISEMAKNDGVKFTLITAGKFKGAGNQFEPLDLDTHARIQTRIDDFYESFVHDVARGRGVTEAAVRNGYGEGDVLTAKRALTAGMVDGIKTFDQAVQAAAAARLGAPVPAAAAENDEPEISAEAVQAQREDEQLYLTYLRSQHQAVVAAS